MWTWIMEITMDEWFGNIINSEADLLLKEYLWNGFSAVEQLLREYSLELVNSPEKTEITNLLKQLSKILYNGGIDILKSIDPNASDTADLIISLDMRSRTDPEFKSILVAMTNLLRSTYLNLSTLDRQWNTEERFNFIQSISPLSLTDIEALLFYPRNYFSWREPIAQKLKLLCEQVSLYVC